MSDSEVFYAVSLYLKPGEIERWNELCFRRFPHFLGSAEEETPMKSRVLEAGLSQIQNAGRGVQSEKKVSFYFASKEDAESFLSDSNIQSCNPVLQNEHAKDWNAEWQKNYQGAEVEPYWSIIPVWQKEGQHRFRPLRMNPSLGFGTGEHPTTQLCLQILGSLGDLSGKSVLDFGSGSGILSVAAALQGAQPVVGVEIDPLALESSRECAQLNGVEDRIQFCSQLPDSNSQKFDVVVANILLKTLLDFAPFLVERLSSTHGVLILSGLLKGQETEIIAVFKERLGKSATSHVAQKGEWVAVEFRIAE